MIFEHDEKVQLLLREFSDVFVELKDFLLLDHMITSTPLLPVNTRGNRPYRNPYFQKAKIEKIIKEMLEAGA